MIKEQKHASELMSKSEKALQMLRERAKQLAKQEKDESEQNDFPYTHFRLDQIESYGVPYQYVQEILYIVIVAKPPFVPPLIARVINWRTLITVIDLIEFFHPHHSAYINRFIILINTNNVTLDQLVNRVEGSEIYQPNQLGLPLYSVNVTNPEYILRLHQAVTAILNVEVLISGLSQEIKKSLYKIGDIHGSC